MDAWPTGWPDAWQEPGVVWRDDVFRVAAAWQAGDAPARHLLTAALVWGYGSTNYGPHRMGVTLAAKDLDDRLDRALAPLRGPDLASIPDLFDAHRRFSSYSDCRLPSLGPAFFTKVLYFAGYRRGQRGVQPLILDDRVVGQLPVQDWPEMQRSRGRAVGRLRPASEWISPRWLAYCNWAWQQATVRGKQADEMEMNLFARRPMSEW